jgi:hypothetical protein
VGVRFQNTGANMINRRTFITVTGAAVIASALPEFSFAGSSPATPQPPQRLLSIAQILAASYPAVLAELRQGYSFISPVLNRAMQDKRIMLAPLGATVVVPGDPHNLSYSILQLNVPLVWTPNDEAQMTTENARIQVVSALLTNGLDSLDTLLEDRLKTHDLVVSSEYLYDRGEVYSTVDTHAYYCLLYTAFAPVPKNSLQKLRYGIQARCV